MLSSPDSGTPNVMDSAEVFIDSTTIGKFVYEQPDKTNDQLMKGNNSQFDW